jgi:hypothetical protein
MFVLFIQLVEERDALKQELQRERRTQEQEREALRQELQRERRAREEAESSTQQALEELQRVRRACQEGDDQIQRLRAELERERSARIEAERRLLEAEAAGQGQGQWQGQGQGQSGGAGSRGLMGACVSTASRSEVEAATQGFGVDRILGRGGFGAVYSAVWRGRDCAIKVLDDTSLQGAKEFLKEINLLGHYRHHNLVPLLGFCIAKDDASLFCALIYPKMKCSLEDALQQSRRAQPGTALSWSTRVSIATDAAAGLAYLHSSFNKPVILHRDIKSANILLEDDNRARVSDVGLSRPLEAAFSQTLGLGTFGYIDSSGYVATGEYTAASDVFSFGVVLLELLTGEPAADATKRPPLLHARVAQRLPNDARVVCDVLAQWPGPKAEQLASIAKSCVSIEMAARPTSQETLDLLLSARVQAPPERVQPEPEPARECIMCMDAPRNTRHRPCCHVVYCAMCAQDALERRVVCPMCRGRVERYDVGNFNATFVPA